MSAISTGVQRVSAVIGGEPAADGGVDADGAAMLTVILAVYDPPLSALRTQLDAIAAQTNTEWECVVVDDASTNPDVVPLLAAWCAVGPRRTLITRLENGGIAAATNDGLDRASGSIVAICDHDDVLHPAAIDRVVDHFDRHPDHDVVYTDEQVIDEHGDPIAEYRKPDYSPRRHLGHHYLAHLVAARRRAIGELRVDAAFEPAQDYDFYLRVIELAASSGRSVGHIPEILYSWRAIAGSSALDAAEKPAMIDAVLRCAQAALDRRSIPASATTVVHQGVPTTSVHVSFDDDIEAHRGNAPQVITFSSDTTPSELNTLVAESTDDLVCLVRNDASITSDGLAVLASNARRPDIGVAGPIVVAASTSATESDRVLLSVGRTLTPTLRDPFHGVAADASGPWGAFFVSREVSAIAPVVAVVERSLFEQAGGLSTDVGVDIGLAELCVRLADSGASTIVDPQAIAIVESAASLLDRGEEAHRTRSDELAIAERRVPTLRVERFATTGMLVADRDAPDVYELARRAIVGTGTALVTSDVFDTIVTRPVSTPSDLFVTLAERLHEASLLDHDVMPSVFAGGRREAERRARTAQAKRARSELLAHGASATTAEADPRVSAPECTLDEVWALMPAAWISNGALESCLEHELDLEAELLSPIPAAIETFRLAHEYNIPVVLVSDIYLSSAQLTDVLVRCGVEMDLVSEVVTSADHRLGKSGGLLAEVITRRGIAPSAVLHLGDNEVADVETARELGATPIHVEVPANQRHIPMPPVGIRGWSHRNGTDLGISAAVRTTLLAAGPLALDPSYQYGAGVVGPVLAGFSRWVAMTAERLGASSVHCMLREGATIAELMSVTAPDGPTPISLHVSRWVTMRAAVIEATPDELLTALARRADLTVDHLVTAFDVDRALALTVLGTERVEPGQIVAACEAVAAHPELSDQIRTSAAKLRERVLVHLRATLQLDDGPIVVADVGWGGTIQEGLQRILAAGGIDQPVIGLYLAMSAPGEQRVRRGAAMHSYLPNEFDDPVAAEATRSIAHHADTIERLMTPESGTLLDISDAGVPITQDASHDRLPPTLRSAQTALRSVVAELADSDNPLSDITDDRWVDDMSLRSALSASLANAIVTPTAALAAALGAWPHDDVAGTGHRSIAGTGLATAARYGNARDLDLIDPAGRNWAAGLAAQFNPALSAQLDAANNAVSLAGLCPESENGLARLAAFEVGSDLARVQVGRAPAVSPGGWSMLRIEGPVESLRSIRFDAGEFDSIVDIAALTIVVTTDLEFDPAPIHIDDLNAAHLVWVSSHPLDTHHFAQRNGGHLIIPIDSTLAPHIRSVEVTAAFRSWVLDDDVTLATTPMVRRIGAQSRRVAGGVKRRLRR